MCSEHQIALNVINSHIDDGNSFSYDQISKEILEQGGILRVSIGVTITMYLRSLREIGLLRFDPQNELFLVNKEALTELRNTA
jgi:hypothetical protein